MFSSWRICVHLSSSRGNLEIQSKQSRFPRGCARCQRSSFRGGRKLREGPRSKSTSSRGSAQALSHLLRSRTLDQKFHAPVLLRPDETIDREILRFDRPRSRLNNVQMGKLCKTHLSVCQARLILNVRRESGSVH